MDHGAKNMDFETNWDPSSNLSLSIYKLGDFGQVT